MTISIGAIKWPENKKSAIRLYLTFLLRTIDTFELRFEEPASDPVQLTRDYLDGIRTDADRLSALSFWWEISDRHHSRNLDSKPALMSRLAICLMSANEENLGEIGEHLSWFIELLGMLGCHLPDAIALMADHFDFEQAPPGIPAISQHKAGR